MSNFLADKSYMAVKPQSVATTPVIPTVFARLLSEGIRLNPNFQADRSMKALDWKSDDLLKGERKIEGPITVWADPEILGHILNMTYAKGSTTGSGSDGYTHPFTPGDGKSYTIEISRGDHAQRIWGARADQLKLSFVDNKLQAEATIKALGQFFTASVGVALTGAGMTSLELSTDYDLRPTDGLLAGDKLLITTDAGSTVEVTLLTVAADGKTVTFASTTVTAAIGNAVFLKAQTPSYGTQREPFYLGNTLVGVAGTSADATTAAGAKATATPCYNPATTLKNNLYDAPASGSGGPSALLNQSKEATVEISRLYENPTQFQKWIENVKQAMTWIATGRFIKSDHTTSEQLTVKFHRVKLLTNEQPLDVGQYVFDKQTFEALWDTSDAAAVEITLVNRTAGTSY